LNIRDEAILREFNLFPLWVKRELSNQIDTGATIPQVTVQKESVPVPVPKEPSAIPLEIPQESKVEPATSSNTALSANWPELKQQVLDCTSCKLRATCTQTVFGVGDEKAEWLFVGEGPGADEDAMGEPFVGQTGKLLDNMLAAIKLKRGKNVYIANVVKCSPPKNRTPEAEEVAQCLPYLQRQIELIKPKLIVALGKTAATALLGRDVTLGSLRGKIHEYQGIPLVITFHPAYLLRSPAEKAKAWEDLCFALNTHSSR
jgi:DNA polymerase